MSNEIAEIIKNPITNKEEAIEEGGEEMSLFKAYDIKWDTDGEDIDLPDTILFSCDDDEADEYISEGLTRETGFCHFGFKFEACEGYSTKKEENK